MPWLRTCCVHRMSETDQPIGTVDRLLVNLQWNWKKRVSELYLFLFPYTTTLLKILSTKGTADLICEDDATGTALRELLGEMLGCRIPKYLEVKYFFKHPGKNNICLFFCSNLNVFAVFFEKEMLHLPIWCHFGCHEMPWTTTCRDSSQAQLVSLCSLGRSLGSGQVPWWKLWWNVMFAFLSQFKLQTVLFLNVFLGQRWFMMKLGILLWTGSMTWQIIHRSLHCVGCSLSAWHFLLGISQRLLRTDRWWGDYPQSATECELLDGKKQVRNVLHHVTNAQVCKVVLLKQHEWFIESMWRKFLSHWTKLRLIQAKSCFIYKTKNTCVCIEEAAKQKECIALIMFACMSCGLT